MRQLKALRLQHKMAYWCKAKNVNVKEAENHAYVEEHYEKKRSGFCLKVLKVV